MTLVSQIITDAFRQSNIISIAGSVTSAQQTEALRFLNRIVKSVFGNEAGENLEAFPIGRNNISRPSGFPGYDNAPPADWFVPMNKRLMCNLTAATTVYLHPQPSPGARFAVNDVTGNFATYNLIVNGNGRQIQNASSLTLNTNNTEKEWFYRDDLGEWALYSPLVVGDTFPFPEEFDDYFITLLALRINPAYGRAMDEQTAQIMGRSQSQLRARYHNTIEVQSEEALIRPAEMTADRRRWRGNYYNPNSLFNYGMPW